MFQRIQTLYFFAALGLTILMLVVPFVRFIDSEGQVFLLQARGIVTTETEPYTVMLNAIPLLIILMVIPLLILTGIFSYKKRMLQIRLSVFSILLLLGSIGLVFFYKGYGATHLSSESYLSLPVVLPLITAILVYLGFRGVRKDEELVRSYDRIR